MFSELSVQLRTHDADRIVQVNGDAFGFRIGGEKAARDQSCKGSSSGVAEEPASGRAWSHDR
jgi:hypothetical protein